MKFATLIALCVLAGAVLWLAGEQHRRNCIITGKTDCSVLPWIAGTTPTAEPASDGKLTEFGCEQLEIDNALALNESDRRPLPPECP